MTSGAIRTHVHLDGLQPDDTATVRAAVDTWHETRQHLDRPDVMHYLAPVTGPDALTVGTWMRCRRYVTVQVVNADWRDLIPLLDVLRVFVDSPRLTFTRDEPGLDA